MKRRELTQNLKSKVLTQKMNFNSRELETLETFNIKKRRNMINMKYDLCL